MSTRSEWSANSSQHKSEEEKQREHVNAMARIALKKHQEAKKKKTLGQRIKSAFTFEDYIAERASLDSIQKQLAEIDKKISAGGGSPDIMTRRNVLWNSLRSVAYVRPRSERAEDDNNDNDAGDGGDGGE